MTIKEGKRYQGDVPLPTSETLPPIKTFLPETEEALKKEGDLIFSLTGKSIGDLIKEGMKFRLAWPEECSDDFEAMRSICSQVAFNPKQLFLPDSNNKTFVQQEKLVKCFLREKSKKIKGIKAIIGELPDFGELALNYLKYLEQIKQTDKRLFGEEYNYDYASTKTLMGKFLMASVGNADTDDSLDIFRWDRRKGHAYVWTFPLIVPA